VASTASAVEATAPELDEPNGGTPDAGAARRQIAAPSDGRASAVNGERDAPQSRTDKPSGRIENGARPTTTTASPGGPVPNVKLVNIGLHIGGGPNDARTKAPFLRALGGAFDDFKRCYGLLGDASAHGTFGIDLLVPAAGGIAATSNPRTAFSSAAFRACMVEGFERVHFDPPQHGATKLSYALRIGNP